MPAHDAIRAHARRPREQEEATLGRPVAPIRRPCNAVLRVRLRGVVLLEPHAATPQLFDDGAHVGDLKNGLHVLARRGRLGGIDEEMVDAIAKHQTQAAVACIEKGLDCLESHLLDVERFGSAQVLCRQRRGDA